MARKRYWGGIPLADTRHMNRSRKFRTPRHLVTLFGATLVVAGAGVALARTSSGPPWAQESPYCAEATADTTAVATDTTVTTDVGVADCVEFDQAQVQQKVEDYFQAVENDCGTAVLGEFDLSNEDTVKAFDALVTGLDSGQKDHMVQSVRVLMANCAAHPNDGLMNALYHHGLNWVRHYEHEQWLQQKFADKWPDGKPGKPDKPEKVHGNPHDFGTSHGNSGSHGHGNGHTEGS